MSIDARSVKYGKKQNAMLVKLCQNGEKTQSRLCEEYDVSLTSLTHWIKQYSTVETNGSVILTEKQVKVLQKYA